MLCLLWHSQCLEYGRLSLSTCSVKGWITKLTGESGKNVGGSVEPQASVSMERHSDIHVLLNRFGRTAIPTKPSVKILFYNETDYRINNLIKG